MKKIRVKAKKVYNQMRYYPMCAMSQLFCDIQRNANKSTPISLGEWQLEIIKKAGWEVEVSE